MIAPLVNTLAGIIINSRDYTFRLQQYPTDTMSAPHASYCPVLLIAPAYLILDLLALTKISIVPTLRRDGIVEL